jgi:hypothetical protein
MALLWSLRWLQKVIRLVDKLRKRLTCRLCTYAYNDYRVPFRLPTPEELTIVQDYIL